MINYSITGNSPMLERYTDLDIPNDLRAQGVPLHQIGIANVAWPRNAALSLLQVLYGRTIAVLGGDVLRLAAGQPYHTYDNWHTDPHPSEDFAQYAARSQEAAAAYIQAYRENGSQHLYLLVLADRLPSQ